MEKLSLTLLGNFAAVLNERPFTQFRTSKVQALLIYLVVEAPANHQREALMELLWPGLPLKSAQVNLRQILYQLNKMMPDVDVGNTAVSLLISDRKTIQLHPSYPLSSDVTTFTALLKRSQRHSHQALLTCSDCRAWLKEAVALYRGDFLADFSLYDSNNYEAWAEATREALRRKTLDALDTLTHIYLAEQDYQQAEKAGRQQLEIDNLRENAYRQLMQVLALTGRRSEAVALYETCQRLLSEELGMAPAAKTTALSEQIKGGSLSLATPIQQGIRGYELGQKLGEGAFGTVYQAHQKGIGREVAIKIIHAKLANQPRFIRRFEAEAQIVARLESPHIVPLYDYWREADGAYLVMRWLRGGSLQAALEKEFFDVETAVSLISQIATALHTAHRQGVIHRDVKPANILLDEEGNAYLSDFGIARDNIANQNITQANELLGSPDYISPEQLLGEEISPATDIYCLGLVLYKLLTGSKPYTTSSMAELIQKQINEPLPLVASQRPDLPAALDDIIQQATAKKAPDRFSSVLLFAEALQQAVRGSNGRSRTPMPQSPTAPETAVAEADIINPYKGLHAFQEQDAAHFYGRQAVVEQLLARLSSQEGEYWSGGENRFLALVGPSGSGKSSLVRAGLIPALNRGALPGSAEWFIVSMTPGSYPLEELEAALLRVAVNPPPSLLEPLQKDERGLLRVLKRLLPQERNVDNSSQLLLVIDQFEELFTLVQSEADRTHFLNILFTALTDFRSRLRVVVTLRADFYDRPLQLPQLGEWLRQCTELVLPLTVAELEQAITAPAASMGITPGPGLVSAMIADVNEQPGALPLLQYALTELFERRNGRTLTLAAYQEIGGITGALARRAEDIFNRLDAPGQEATRQLFLRLITLGEGVEDTRRRVLQAELEGLSVNRNPLAANGIPISEYRLPVSEYGRYRLLTFDRDPVTRGATVEVAHEALLREWPRLREWLADSREDVRRQRLLSQAAQQWETASHENSYLLRGSRLLAFEAWAATTTVALTENERHFLATSVAARDQRQAEEEARRQRELETARQLAEEQTRRIEEQAQAAKSLRQRALVLAGAFVASIILAVTAFGFARSSASNADLAGTREAEAQANAQLATTREAEAEVEREAAVFAQETAVAEADFRAIAEADALAQQDIAEQQEAVAQEQLRLSISRELALAANANLVANPERSLLLGLKALDSAYTIEAEEALRTALQMSRIEFTLKTEADDVTWVDYHPDGLWVAGVSDAGGQIIIWDTSSGEKLRTVSLDTTGIRQLELSSDGTRLGVATQNKIMLLDTSSWEVIQVLEGHLGPVRQISFDPESTRLASGSEDGVMKIWQVATGEEQLSLIASDIGWVANVIFSRDGSRIATVGDDLTARVWDANTGDELHRMKHDAIWVTNVAFNADGTRLFVAPIRSASGSDLVIWDIETESDGVQTEPLFEWFDLHDNSFTEEIVLSPDGRFLATASQDNTVKLWDATSDTPVEILTLSGHQSVLRDIAFSPDGSRLVSTSAGEARIWNITEAGYGEFLNIADSAYPIAFTPDNARLITNSSDHFISSGGTIKIWDVATGTVLESFDSLVTNVKSAAVSDSGRYVAVGGTDNVVKIWDLTTLQEILTMSEHGPGNVGGIHTGVMWLDFSPDDALLATAGADGFVMVWDVATGEKRYEWRVDPRDSAFSDKPLANGATSVQFSPDGQLLAASTEFTPDEEGGMYTSLVKIWNLSSGEERLIIPGLPWRNWSLAFSPDSQRLAALGNAPPGLGIWDVTTGEQVTSLELIQGASSLMSFSADGRRLFTGHSEVVVWDLETGNALFRLPEATRIPVISADGRFLAAQGNGRIHIYALDFEELLEIAQARVTRELTEAECKEYLHLDTCP